jgi:hypothetical protein
MMRSSSTMKMRSLAMGDPLDDDVGYFFRGKSAGRDGDIRYFSIDCRSADKEFVKFVARVSAFKEAGKASVAFGASHYPVEKRVEGYVEPYDFPGGLHDSDGRIVVGNAASGGDYQALARGCPGGEMFAGFRFALNHEGRSPLVIEFPWGTAGKLFDYGVGVLEYRSGSLGQNGCDGALPRMFHPYEVHNSFACAHGIPPVCRTIPENRLVLKGERGYPRGMSLAGILASSFLPAVLWLSYTLNRRYLSLRDCVLSILSGFAALGSAVVLALALDAIVPSWLLYALAEEGMKLFFVYIFARHLSLNRSLYSFAILGALVFSALETVRYGIYHPSVILLRTVTSLPLHASCAVIAAYALTRGHDASRKRVLCFVGAVILHAAYNASMGEGGSFIAAAFAVLLVSVFFARRLWSRV